MTRVSLQLVAKTLLFCKIADFRNISMHLLLLWHYFLDFY